MAANNLSEELFKPRFNHPETSSLVQRQFQPGTVQPTADGGKQQHWYRALNRLLWICRGITPIELSEVLARIATSDGDRTCQQWLDTVLGYRNGNWIYEWSQQAAGWQARAQARAQAQGDTSAAGQSWLRAANLFSLASYPHIKGDELAEQAQALASRAWEQAACHLPTERKALSFAMPGGSAINGFLHMPTSASAPYPVVLMCGGLDSLQSDHYWLFHDYLAPRGLAMLTIDMPSVGGSVKWKLTQDASFLHQQVLQQLTDVPWIDHSRVAALGYRFGANVVVRLAYLEARRLKCVACLGPVVHNLLSDAQQQDKVPPVYLDILASRLGAPVICDTALRSELNRFSLKVQGLLGRRTPTPMLAGYWQDDPFSPEAESQLIAQSSLKGRVLLIPSRPVRSGVDCALSEISQWIAQHLCQELL